MSRFNTVNTFFNEAYPWLCSSVALTPGRLYADIIFATDRYNKSLQSAIYLGIILPVVLPLTIVGSVAGFAIAAALSAVIAIVHLLSLLTAATIDAFEDAPTNNPI
jgi:hypothetical protein